MIGHDWEFGTPASKAKYQVEKKAKSAAATPYDLNPELDGNIKTTLHNLANAEKRLGSSEKIQLESDPICSSAGCT